MEMQADFIDPDSLLLIVVGAHLRAEMSDRPLAQRLRERMLRWQCEHEVVQALTPLVCTDLWHLNHQELLRRPAVCLGSPDVNASTA